MIKERSFLVNETRMEGLLSGQKGRKILFLHGWKGSSESWRENMKGLGTNYECVAVDLPGFGKSEEPKKVWDLDDYVDSVRDLIDVLDWKRYVLIGKSFGARVAIKLATEDDGKLERLVLVSAAGLESKSSRVKAKIMIAKAGRKVARFFLKEKMSGVKQAYYNLVGSELEDGQKMEIKKKVVTEDLSGILEKIKTPTLVVWGSEDRVISLEDGEQMVKAIDGAELKVIDGGTHWVHEEEVGEFNKIIKDWLQD